MSEESSLSSFDEAFDSMPYSILIISDIKIVYANKIFRDLSGYSKKDLAKMTSLDFIHEDDRGLIKERRKILQKGELPEKDFQIRFIHKDGSVSLGSVTASNIIYNGNLCRIFIGRNISAQPLIEQSPELVFSIIDVLTKHSELGFWVDDLNEKTVYINETLCEVLGYTFDEIKEKSVTDFLHPISQETYRQILNDRKEGKTTSSYELILINKEGKPNTFRVVGSMLYDSRNIPLGTVGFFTNIESIKKLSQIVSTLNKYALYSKYKDLSSFWNNVLDDITRIFYADFGVVFLDSEILAQNGEFKESFSPQDLLEELAREGKVVSYMERNCRDFFKGGKSAVVSTLFLNKQPAGFILIGSTIKNLFLPEDIDLFMTFSNQITLNYEHHFLYLESEDERDYVANLLDILSHDFLNANTSVHGYLELLNMNLNSMQKEKLEELVQRSLKVVERSERILQTVNQLTKIQKERRVRRTIKLLPILKDALYIKKELVSPRKIKVSMDCNEKTTILGGDLLQVVFENIIDNAIKYTETQEVEIEIQCKKIQIEDENLIEISISDYGTGIKNELKPTFFRRLTRGDSRFQEATKLGLYLAGIIVEAYNGSIHFENRVEDDYTQGTKVIILLPEGE